MTKFSGFHLLTLFIASHLLSLASCNSTQDLINQICRQTSDFGYCNDILNRNLPTPSTDLVGITKLTILLTLSNAKDTKIYLEKAEAAEKNATRRQLYAGCADDYYQVEVKMFVAAYDVGRGEYKGMVENLQASSRLVILCQNALGDLVYDVRERNRKLRVLLTMGLYEGSLLTK
ncbi:hypothetical protein Salat_1258400 [Sesamum alatum]|uniref:Pectinesterase inhibitor domain-containing protein n=1 Tax=Sesamum alatum TaxID=300844 RepID=A0AAE1YGE6_9LAMI|nr:hypothetical protein Salat_1258400 [Sesamum alatum]